MEERRYGVRGIRPKWFMADHTFVRPAISPWVDMQWLLEAEVTADHRYVERCSGNAVEVLLTKVHSDQPAVLLPVGRGEVDLTAG